MAFSFLTAHWSHLINITYPVPPEVLAPHVPEGVELDVRDGSAFASIVAFDFLNTRVLGIPWPGYRDFPELNLRYYLKRGDQRGVAFIREFVPKRLIASMANVFYNEPYAPADLTSSTTTRDDLVTYELTMRHGGRDHTVRATGITPAYTPAPDSLDHYFKEHKWGFGSSRRGRTLTYEVRHPVWEVWDVQSWAIDLDFEALYGPEWAFLARTDPLHVTFAVGSDVEIKPRGDLSDVEGPPMNHAIPHAFKNS